MIFGQIGLFCQTSHEFLKSYRELKLEAKERHPSYHKPRIAAEEPHSDQGKFQGPLSGTLIPILLPYHKTSLKYGNGMRSLWEGGPTNPGDISNQMGIWTEWLQTFDG